MLGQVASETRRERGRQLEAYVGVLGARGAFPGFTDRAHVASEGVAHRLKGAAVIGCTEVTGFQGALCPQTDRRHATLPTLRDRGGGGPQGGVGEAVSPHGRRAERSSNHLKRCRQHAGLPCETAAAQASKPLS